MLLFLLISPLRFFLATGGTELRFGNVHCGIKQLERVQKVVLRSLDAAVCRNDKKAGEVELGVHCEAWYELFRQMVVQTD